MADFVLIVVREEYLVDQSMILHPYKNIKKDPKHLGEHKIIIVSQNNFPEYISNFTDWGVDITKTVVIVDEIDAAV